MRREGVCARPRAAAGLRAKREAPHARIPDHPRPRHRHRPPGRRDADRAPPDRGGERRPVAETRTNADGRTDAPILPEGDFAPGTYELTFHAGDYLGAAGVPGEAPRFLDAIPIRFGMAEALHYHVPLLLSPYGYSTYRGS